MKRSIALVLALMFCGIASAQTTGPVVANASFLAWDHEIQSAAITDEYRIYLSRTSGVVPDTTPDAVVAAPSLQWAISGLQPGPWYVIVTAFDVESGAESAASLEIPFFVLAGPTNVRIQ